MRFLPMKWVKSEPKAELVDDYYLIYHYLDYLKRFVSYRGVRPDDLVRCSTQSSAVLYGDRRLLWRDLVGQRYTIAMDVEIFKS